MNIEQVGLTILNEFHIQMANHTFNQDNTSVNKFLLTLQFLLYISVVTVSEPKPKTAVFLKNRPIPNRGFPRPRFGFKQNFNV